MTGFTGVGNENKNNKRHKKCVTEEKKLSFEDYKPCLVATQLESKTNQLEKNKQACHPQLESSPSFSA